MLIGYITRLVRVIYSTLGARVSLDMACSPIRVLRVLRGAIMQKFLSAIAVNFLSAIAVHR